MPENDETHELTFDTSYFDDCLLVGIYRGVDIYLDPVATRQWTERFARYDLLETVSQRVERAVSEIAEMYDLDPHTYLIRCPEKHFKLALELRPEDRDRSRFIGLIHAALFLDEYVDRSNSGQDTYVRNIEHHIRSLVVRTRQGGGYAIVHEVAESPFYQHIIEAGEHRTSHRIIHVGDDAIRRDDPE